MARIIYGVAGEGFGHSSRSHLIGQKFLDAGHDCIFVGSQKSLVYLKQYFGECVKEIMGNVKPGFAYPRRWLISATCNGLRRFNKDEVEIGLFESVKTGKLRYLYETDSYELQLS